MSFLCTILAVEKHYVIIKSAGACFESLYSLTLHSLFSTRSQLDSRKQTPALLMMTSPFIIMVLKVDSSSTNKKAEMLNLLDAT